MKRVLLICLIFLFSLTSSFANDRDVRLDQLFNELKVNKAKVASIVEQEIWSLWSTHPTDEKLTARLEEGSMFVRNQQPKRAREIFTEVINLDENWAEAWNKRATVLYMLGEYQKSQEDIDKVLELEPRHFGALAGQGLVNLELKNYEKALKSYEEVIKIYPSMNSPKVMIKQLKDLIQKQSI